MQRRTKRWQFAGVTLAGLGTLGLFIRMWVIPAMIVAQVESHYKGKVTIRDWWWNGKTAGLVGLTLYEGPDEHSIAWVTVECVSTDLSVGGLIGGRFMPRQITLDVPRVSLRLDRNGRPLTRIPIAVREQSSRPAPPSLPAVLFKEARVTVRQEGRPEMVVSGVSGHLIPDSSGNTRFSAFTNERTWGRWDARGEFSSGFKRGQVCLAGHDIEATPEKEACIPFVPVAVWKNVLARGPLDVHLDVQLAQDTAQPVAVRTEIALRQSALTLPVFGLDATGTTGSVVIENGIVKLNRVAGRAIGGNIETSGTLDFSRQPPQFDLSLTLDRVHVADSPRTWQLDRMGLSGGLMSGKSRVRATLVPGGVDLTGTTGDAEIKGAMMQGFPVKSLHLVMRAEGTDLHYEARNGSRVAREDPAVDRIGPVPPQEKVPAQTPPKRVGPTVRLPRSFSTEIDLEDVELKTLVARAALLRIKLPSDLAGRFSLKVRAAIPLGDLRDVKAYVIHGRASLAGASIAGVDVAHASARLDLDDGILEMTDFQGVLVNLPDGGGDNRPEPVEPIAPNRPLPEGGFRGGLRAELSPPGRLLAHLEADQLPLGELVAPVLPRPTPVSGLVSVVAKADAAINALTDPKAWKATGRLDGAHITHGTATLDSLSARFSLDGGTLAIPELTAQLAGRPLEARLNAQLHAPYGYDGEINVGDWSLDELLALIPTAPRPAPVGGQFAVRADARGTLVPWTVETRGEGRLSKFRAGPVPLGDLPFRWTTAPEEIVVDRIVARPFGGQLVAHARVPSGPGRSAEAWIDLIGIDAAQLSAAMPEKDLKMAGIANLRVSVAAPTERKPDAPALSADAILSSPDLTVQGIPAREGHGTLSIRESVLTYEVRTDALDSRIRLRGDVLLANALGGGGSSQAQLQAGWFSVEDILKAQGVTGPVANFQGTAAVSARVSVPRDPTQSRAHAVGEVRGLRWRNIPLGNVRGDAVVTPTHWEVKPLTGDLLGSPIQGDLWREAGVAGPPRLGGKLKFERIDLAKLGAFLPGRANDQDFRGYASVSLEGHQEKATAEIRIEHAKIFDIPVADLHVPAELGYEAGSGLGSYRFTRRPPGLREASSVARHSSTSAPIPVAMPISRSATST